MNKKTLTALLSVLLAVVLGIFGIFQNDSPASVPETPTLSTTAATQADLLDIQGSYTSKEDVALYIHLYGKLPDNFITKDEARKFGWDGGSVEPYAPGKSIGGDQFGNFEGLLPDAPGRTWTECDIDTLNSDDRGQKRIIWSDNWDIYYTDDKYKSFEKLYDGIKVQQPENIDVPDENGVYDTKDEVALYLYTYHHLPSNFMTKKEARKLGWDGGALSQVVSGMCLGGDVYSNYEGVLPDIPGNYYECDIDTLNRKKRGEKRIIWSDDWDIYYTEDHYETFEKLYGD
jgi:guanyl-specific ribonuclease Sa